jgi:hypothetical protein
MRIADFENYRVYVVINAKKAWCDMDLMKNTTFVTWLWIFCGILVVVLGVYREHLYRDNDSHQQKKLMEMQKRVLDEQIALKNTVNELVRQGKITKATAQEILKTVVSSQVTLTEEVIMKLSPDDHGQKKNE